MLGVCGGCQLGLSFSFLHTGFGSITNMVTLGDIFFSCRVDGTSTFSTYRNPQDHRIFYSSWTNYRLLDVLPHQITEFFSQYRYISIQHLPEPQGITEFFFSSWRNVRPVDVLPHQIAELSSQY
ncbi:hypothetical protein TNCV_508011 [Trichonephila clavipes]|nr:hypothetical protein TNCV_508011 [Trichonephila clavipes]